MVCHYINVALTLFHVFGLIDHLDDDHRLKVSADRCELSLSALDRPKDFSIFVNLSG